MAKGPTGAWDWFQFGPSVVLRETTGEYWMFFVGQTSQDPVASSSCIGFARSTDGVNWTDKSQLFTEQDLALLVGTSVDRVGGPRYFRDPQDGTEYLYFDYLLNSGFAKIGRVVIVPEPGTLVLLAVGVTGALAGRSIRKRQG
jgi:hypothetical protein